MVTGELKDKIDRLWELFWMSGLTSPLDAIEQVTYLMFIYGLDRTDNVRNRDGIMLSKLVTVKTNGQFRMPRYIIRMMLEFLGLQLDNIICDPACGASGFLVATSI